MNHPQPQNGNTEQGQPEPLTITIDFPAQAAAIRAAADPAAHLRSIVVSVVDTVTKETWTRAAIAGATAALKSIEVSTLLEQSWKNGYSAGQRVLKLDDGSAAALGKAMAAGLSNQPPVVVNVPQQPAPKVTIENNVVVPARKVVARPQKDGSVEMTPVDESTR